MSRVWTPSPLLQRTIDRSAFFLMPGCECCGCQCRTYATHRRWNLALEKQWDRNLDPRTNNGDGNISTGYPLGFVRQAAIGLDESVYIIGETRNNLGAAGPESSIAKFGADGRCIREIFPYIARALALRDGSLIVSTDATGSLDCLRKYDLDLNQVWSTFPSSTFGSICIDAAGNIYCTGSAPSGGDSWALWGFDPDGNELWHAWESIALGDSLNCVCTDDSFLYCGSVGDGSLFGPPRGVVVVDLDGNDVDYIETIEYDVRAIAVRNGILVAACFSGDTCNLQAFSTSDYSTLWTRSRTYETAKTPFENGGLPQIAIGADALIYTAGPYPNLEVFDSSGNLVACRDHNGSAPGTAGSAVAVSDVSVVTGGRVFTCDGGGSVSCPDASCSPP